MIFSSTLPLTLTLALLALRATATPVRNSGSTPTCPTGPFPTAPDCTYAYCHDGAISGGDGWCRKLCSCSQSSPGPPATPVRHPGSTPTCPTGPFPTAPDCTYAYCHDGAISGGDGWCRKLCSCPQSAPDPPMQAPPPPPPLVPAPQPTGLTLDCGNAALSDNPNLPEARNTPGSVQAWCELPGVNAGCVDGKVVVNGTDTDNVCRPLCRCS